ncbi:hypothetical protein ACWFR1_13935 [Streptomyces sp. NPDC055103]
MAGRRSRSYALVFNANTRVLHGPTEFAAFETRRRAERVLRDSGVPLVVIRPPVYLDNLFSRGTAPRSSTRACWPIRCRSRRGRRGCRTGAWRRRRSRR